MSEDAWVRTTGSSNFPESCLPRASLGMAGSISEILRARIRAKHRIPYPGARRNRYSVRRHRLIARVISVVEYRCGCRSEPFRRIEDASPVHAVSDERVPNGVKQALLETSARQCGSSAGLRKRVWGKRSPRRTSTTPDRRSSHRTALHNPSLPDRMRDHDQMPGPGPH
jgi:hypothetical protein